jgi:hypothetical protein
MLFWQIWIQDFSKNPYTQIYQKKNPSNKASITSSTNANKFGSKVFSKKILSPKPQNKES